MGAGCSSGNGTSTGQDSGADSSISVVQPGDDGSSPETDGSKVNSGADGGVDSGPVTPHAKILFVHASPDAPAVRFCVGLTKGDGGATTLLPKPPAPNSLEGLPPGLGGPAGDPGSSILGESAVTLYAVPVANIPAVADGGVAPNCEALITTPGDAGSDAAASPLPYYTLGTIPTATLVDGSSWLLALTGCLPNSAVADSTPGACGLDYDVQSGNLTVKVWPLDTTTTIAANAIGAQFVHASTAYDAVIQTALNPENPPPPLPLSAGFYVLPAALDAGAPADAGDAGTTDAAPPTLTPTFLPIANAVNFGTIEPSRLSAVQGVTFDGNSGFFVAPVTYDGGATLFSPVTAPLPVIQKVSWPNGVPTASELANGSGYVFILLGNPEVATFTAAPDGGDAGPTFNPQGLHFLAFPTNPPFGSQ